MRSKRSASDDAAAGFDDPGEAEQVEHAEEGAGRRADRALGALGDERDVGGIAQRAELGDAARDGAGRAAGHEGIARAHRSPVRGLAARGSTTSPATSVTPSA